MAQAKAAIGLLYRAQSSSICNRKVLLVSLQWAVSGLGGGYQERVNQ